MICNNEWNKFMNKPLYCNPVDYDSAVYNTGNDKKVINDYFVVYKIAVKIRKKNLKGEQDIMDKCRTCLNSRGVISENDWHYICCLSKKEATDCATNKKDYYVTIKSLCINK